MRLQARLAFVLLVVVAGLLLLNPQSAGAIAVPGHAAHRQLRGSTDMVMSGTGPGQSVRGYIADENNPFDPVVDGYPSGNPGAGWTAKNESFAGIIYGRPVGTTAQLKLYCIDILTLTRNGIGYILDTWDGANVPNVGYVAHLLTEYYPNDPNRPSGLTDPQKAAAVQAAIWFFSDRYVLSTSDPLRSTVEALVNDVIAEGPLVKPPPPSLSITPPSLSGTAGRVLGPYTVTTDHPPAKVTATGAFMYSDAAADDADQIPNGSPVASGTKIWLRSSGPSSAVLEATSVATVPTGNVYLYDGLTSGTTDAQKLILAEEGSLESTVKATAEFRAPGALTVRKTTAGPDAGSQGTVVIRVRCDDGVTRPPLVIPAGAAAGTRERHYDDIAVGTVCTVMETANGENRTTQVTVIGNGQSATIESGQIETLRIIDIYHHAPGSLIVRKIIAGPAAGQQGEVTVHAVCDGTTLTPAFVIPAGAAAGEHTKQYNDIPTPADCKVTETADGSSSSVSAVVDGSGHTVHLSPGDIAQARITDTYGLVAGQLDVTKSITGPLAGKQGQIVIQTVCDGAALVPDLVIPAGATGDHSQLYSNIPTPASCTVTETRDGSTSSTSAVVSNSPQTVHIAPGGASAASITDTYGPAPGSLLVSKTIAGPAAGQQGAVTIEAVCDGTALQPDFVIAAGAKAGTVSHSYDGIPAGSHCTVTETADGATNTVAALVTGSGQSVTVPAGDIASANLTDLYERDVTEPEIAETPRGYLRVTKTIAGPAAGKQGEIAILVDCGGPIRKYAFRIPAHQRAGSISRVIPNLPAGTRCTVTETSNGHTADVTAHATGSPRTVTISPRRVSSVHLADTYFGTQAVSVTG